MRLKEKGKESDKEGEERCKECNLKYNGYCYKCNMAYYKDEKNQKRCSTCDIKIESQYEKPCECDPWYPDGDDYKCKTCHEKVDGKCIPQTTKKEDNVYEKKTFRRSLKLFHYPSEKRINHEKT